MAYYPFSSNVNDESGNGLNGTLNGATFVVDRFGNLNSALHFNPNTDVKLPTLMFLSNSTNFSFSFWIRYPDGIHWSDIFNAGGKCLISVDRGETGIKDTISIMHQNFSAQGHTNNNGTSWNHLVIVFDGSLVNVFDGSIEPNPYRIYQNGTLIDALNYGASGSNWNASIFPSYQGTEIFLLGNITHYSTEIELDDVGFWNRILTETEIQELYTGITDIDVFENGKITIFPNPVSNYINVEVVNSIEPAFIELYNTNGIIVLKKDVSQENNISVKHLKRGVYIYKLNHKNMISTGKIVLR